MKRALDGIDLKSRFTWPASSALYDAIYSEHQEAAHKLLQAGADFGEVEYSTAGLKKIEQFFQPLKKKVQDSLLSSYAAFKHAKNSTGIKNVTMVTRLVADYAFPILSNIKPVKRRLFEK